MEFGAERNVARRTHVQPRAAGGHDVDQRVAPAVFDVVDAAADDVLGRRSRRDRHFVGTDRDRCALPVERQLAYAGESQVGRFEHHAVTALFANRQVDHVAIAHEPRDVQVRRLRVNLLRARDLLDDAVLHHDDAVGERERLVLIVRHVDRRAAELAMNAPDLGARFEPQLRVEVRQRLVHQDQRRLDHDRTRNGNALLLTARELAGKLLLLPGQLNEAHRLLDARRDVGRADAPHAQAKADVLLDAHVREERVVLEHHAEAAPLGRQRIDALLIEPDRAARQRQEPGDAVQRRRLPAARRAEQRDELAATDRHRQLGQRVENVAAAAGEAARHALEPQFLEIVLHRELGRWGRSNAWTYCSDPEVGERRTRGQNNQRTGCADPENFTWSSAPPLAGPTGGTSRPAPSLRAIACAETPSATDRIRRVRTP